MNQRNLQPTIILDYASPKVLQFAGSIVEHDGSTIGFLRGAHAALSREVGPIYSIREQQPVSRTLSLGQGSCSQRLACLEAIARFKRIPTRVRALWVAGRFWSKRFPLTRVFIPRRILLPWPQFYIGTQWIGIEELFGRLEDRALDQAGFANDGETLFEAVQTGVVDFEGRTRSCSPLCDLSLYVEGTDGVYDARDDMFRHLGTLESTWKGRAFELLYGGRKSA